MILKNTKYKEKPPLEVIQLKNYVEEWDTWKDYLVIKTSDLTFQQLLIKKQRIPLSFDYSWILVGVLDASSQVTEVKNLKQVYKLLKTNETELKWISRGFLKEIPIFYGINNENSEKNLSEILNSNKELIKLIKEVDPTSVRIFLESMSPDDLDKITSDQDLVQVSKKYEENPSRIVWNTLVKRLTYPSPWSNKILLNCVKIIEIISQTLLEFTKKAF